MRRLKGVYLEETIMRVRCINYGVYCTEQKLSITKIRISVKLGLGVKDTSVMNTKWKPLYYPKNY